MAACVVGIVLKLAFSSNVRILAGARTKGENPRKQFAKSEFSDVWVERISHKENRVESDL
ncbi:MAG: hypothetical protein CMJ64_01555 [Planctomycetaceae bacterium]|nr:hypothetical protein [Planctomycetaceae bacterium]